MGASFGWTRDTVRLNTKFMNNTLQSSTGVCSINNVQNANNNYVYVNGSKVRGGIGVKNTSQADGSCALASTMNNSITQMLAETISQQASSSSSLFGIHLNASSNTITSHETMINNLTQMNQQTCAINTFESTNNNFVYVNGSSEVGFIGVSNSSKSQSNCSLQNTQKNVVYTQSKTGIGQKSTIKGAFGGLIGFIIAVVVLLIAFIVIVFTVGAAGKVGYDTYKKGQTENQPNNNPNINPNDPNAEQKSYLEGLGFSPDDVNDLISSGTMSSIGDLGLDTSFLGTNSPLSLSSGPSVSSLLPAVTK